MYGQTASSFYPSYVYIILDIFFVIFSILYMLGDTDHYDITVLRCAKPIPTWIMIIQLFPTRNFHSYIKVIMVALFFGSVGDILLEISSISDILFDLGALAFLVGHLLYVISFISLAKDISENRTTFGQVMSLKAVYIVIWIVLQSFSFWSISYMVKYLEQDSIMNYVLPVYGTFLVMLCMGGFFFFFTCFRISADTLQAGIFFMIGALVFYTSDNILAHNKFNKNPSYMAKFSKSFNAYWIMITYYVAQFLIGKGAFMVCAHFEVTRKKTIEPDQINQPSEIRT